MSFTMPIAYTRVSRYSKRSSTLSKRGALKDLNGVFKRNAVTGNVPPILARVPSVVHGIIFTLCIYAPKFASTRLISLKNHHACRNTSSLQAPSCVIQDQWLTTYIQ